MWINIRNVRFLVTSKSVVTDHPHSVTVIFFKTQEVLQQEIKSLSTDIHHVE